MRRYNPREIEPKWQAVWAESGIYKTDMSRTADKAYVIPMLPYPSGDLHIGHWYNFGPTDTVARFRRMLGQNVFTTIGFDAFGLPAENAAIQRGIQPAVWTHSNIESMKKQIAQIGASYDWDHTLETCDPNFYRWNQWLFLKLYEKGLAYRAKALVNWDPVDKTVLANEQVVDGKGERSGAVIEQKYLEQWFFKITDYAERLLDDLEAVDWPKKVKTMQQNWIGKSQGALIDFEIPLDKENHTTLKTNLQFIPKWIDKIISGKKNVTFRLQDQKLQSGDFFRLLNYETGEPFAIAKVIKTDKTKLKDIPLDDPRHEIYGTAEDRRKAWSKYHQHNVTDEDTFWIYEYKITSLIVPVFTTRPDTIFGATYMVLAPEHPLVKQITSDECRERVEQYIEETNRKTELERKEAEKHKTGTFTGAYAINPATKKKIPVWIADYVLSSYGTGAIMAVPAHDERDGEFARKFDLPIVNVVEPVFVQNSEESKVKPDLPFAERQAITAIVKHWSEDKYIGLKWKTVDWDTFITGGVEKGQNAEQAAIAEIREETGYQNPKLVKQLDNVHAKFFHVPKDENRFAHFSVFYFELEDDERKQLSQNEQNNHEVIWLSADDMEKFRLPDSHRYNWNQLHGRQAWYTGEGKLINSGKYTGLDSAAAREKIVADLEQEDIAKEQVNYRLRDWLISRQRYWGTPIPIVYCDKCGIQPVPEKDLPVILPEDVEFELSGQSPLIHRPDFVNTKCPNCGGDAKRETDTMDTFMDSSWYFLRYVNQNDKAAFDVELVNKWLPVDHYIGGIEHAILHLLYARFMVKFLHDEHGLAVEEPFKKLTNQGIILGPDGQKMSKSRGNVVNPDEQVNSYGADSLRLYLMFMGPYDQGGPYDMSGIAGTRRFLDRFWVLVEEFLESKDVNTANDLEIIASAHKTIKKVTKDLERLGFNTAIASMMSLVNELYRFKAEEGVNQSPGWRFALEALTQLLAPLAPHISEEIWENLGHDSSIHISAWPLWDEKLVAEEVMTLAVQINGKVRSEIVVETGIDRAEAVKVAKEDTRIAPLIDGKTIKKEIYVPGRLVNLVI